MAVKAKIQYPNWTLIDWDGNPDLNLKCWRKTFGAGHVSVGIGDFLCVVFSYGPNSSYSYSSTRWNYDAMPLTEAETMAAVDASDGRKILIDREPLRTVWLIQHPEAA